MNFRYWLSRVAVLSLAIAAYVVPADNARAQAYPNRPVTFIVPYGPGSGNDAIARVLAGTISDNWGSPVVVVNRAGATGAIGLEATAKSPPDGYTMVIGSTSQIINQHLSRVRYDMLKDFVPTSLSGTLSYSVSVLSTFPANTLKELVAVAKARPGKLNGTGTIGSMAHFQLEMLKAAGNVDIVMVPNKNPADNQADVLSGRVEIYFSPLNSVLPHAKTGKMRVLAVSGERRAPDLSDVPTMAEAGFPSVDAVAVYYILVPAGTPKPVIGVLNREIVKAMASREVRERLAALGVDPRSSTTAEASSTLKAEVERWSKIVKESGIRLD